MSDLLTNLFLFFDTQPALSRIKALNYLPINSRTSYYQLWPVSGMNAQ